MDAGLTGLSKYQTLSMPRFPTDWTNRAPTSDARQLDGLYIIEKDLSFVKRSGVPTPRFVLYLETFSATCATTEVQEATVVGEAIHSLLLCTEYGSSGHNLIIGLREDATSHWRGRESMDTLSFPRLVQ